MRVPDATLDEVRERRFLAVEGFLAPEELAAAQDALWMHFPRPRHYFADPDRFARYRREPVRRRGGIPVPLLGPEPAGHPPRPRRCGRALPRDDRAPSLQGGAVGQVRRRRRTTTSRCTATTGATASSCRVRSARYQQLTTFVYLSDVTEDDGPTCIVPYDSGKDVPYTPLYIAVRVAGRRRGALHRTGGEPPPLPDRHPAPGVGHHGSRGARGSRSSPTTRSGGTTWGGKMAWPKQSPERWAKFIPQCSVRQRDLFGFPRPGDPYWTEETLDGVAARYPGIDLEPYRARAFLIASRPGRPVRCRRHRSRPGPTLHLGVHHRRKGGTGAGTTDLGVRGRHDEGVRGGQRRTRHRHGAPGRATGPTGSQVHAAGSQRERPPRGDRGVGHPGAPGQVHGGTPRRGTGQGWHRPARRRITWIELVAHHRPGG